MMEEVMRREWDFSAPLMAATGFPLSGVWHARAEGCWMGVYSSLIFLHMCSWGERVAGGGGAGGRRGKPLVPESALDLVGAVLRSSIVLGEGERKCGCSV